MAVVQWCVLNKGPVIDAISGYLVEVSVEPSGYKKALLLDDRECAFCRSAAAYWEQVAKDQVNVLPAKTGVGSEYGFLSGGTLDAVTLIEGSGEIFAGTGAAFSTHEDSKESCRFCNLVAL